MADRTKPKGKGRAGDKLTAQSAPTPQVTSGSASSPGEASKPSSSVTLEQFNTLADEVSEMMKMPSSLSSSVQHGRDAGGATGISSSIHVGRSSLRTSIGGTTVTMQRNSTRPGDNGMSMQDIDGARQVGGILHPAYVTGASSRCRNVTLARAVPYRQRQAPHQQWRTAMLHQLGYG